MIDGAQDDYDDDCKSKCIHPREDTSSMSLFLDDDDEHEVLVKIFDDHDAELTRLVSSHESS